jgi:hypothetical protein
VAAPVLFGLSVDWTGTYAYGWTGMALAFAVAAVAAARSGSMRTPKQPLGVAGRHRA